MSVSTQNQAGQWVPAIPLPLYVAFGRCRCSCGETRWSERSYREHYALTHIIEGIPVRRPSVHAVVNRGLSRGGYPSSPTPVGRLPKVPTGPAPGARRPPTLDEAAETLARVNRTIEHTGPVCTCADDKPGCPYHGEKPTVHDTYAEHCRERRPGTPAHGGGRCPLCDQTRPVHFDAGGDDTIACGRGTGFSTRNYHEVSCEDCAAIGRIIAYGTPPVGLCVVGYPAHLSVPAGWERTATPTTLRYVGATP